MEISNQEKIYLSYIFISAYENIVNLIKPFHNTLSEIIKGSSDVNNDLIISMKNIFIEKFNNNKSLKIKDTHRLLVDVNLMSKQDLELLIMLSKIRNNIGHESLKIYFDEKITYDYFKLEDLLKLYKTMFNKFSIILSNEKNSNLQTILNENNLNYSSLSLMIDNLLTDFKFKDVKNILK